MQGMGEPNPLVAIEAIYSNSFLLGATPGADKSMTRSAAPGLSPAS
jgi:hypothetical protein